MKYPAYILGVVFISAAVFVGLYKYLPLDWLNTAQQSPSFGSTITTIQGTDTLSSSRSVINTNFANLNADKVEAGSTNIFSLLQQFANASSSKLSCYGPCYFGATATSSFSSTGVLSLISALGLTSGGTNASSFTTTGAGIYYNGTSLLTAPLTSAITFTYASTTMLSATYLSSSATSTFGGIGIGTTTPTYGLSITASSSALVTETRLGTSTSAVISFLQGNQQLFQIGGSATAISFTGAIPGATLRLMVCNGAGTAGAITFTGVEWAGGAAPSQTTTAKVCDVYSFLATLATSTQAAPGVKLFGAASLNFQ